MVEKAGVRNIRQPKRRFLYKISQIFFFQENPAWEINPELYIINMTYVKCTSELIMGDRIISINGIIPKSATEACSALTPNPAAPVKMVVERRKHAVPVPPERMAKIKASRLEGFAYFLVNCVNTGKQAKATLGFTLSLLKTKAHIVTVEAGSIAAQHFAIGDALLDVDGEPIPFADINFLKSFSQKFFKDGKFSVVIERPTSPLRITQYAVVYKMMLPQSDAEIEMGADAIKIGMEASAMHSLVFKKIKPKSCLTADLTNTPATTTTTMEEPERKVCPCFSLYYFQV